jgi:hypothetical protein
MVLEPNLIRCEFEFLIFKTFAIKKIKKNRLKSENVEDFKCLQIAHILLKLKM